MRVEKTKPEGIFPPVPKHLGDSCGLFSGNGTRRPAAGNGRHLPVSAGSVHGFATRVTPTKAIRGCPGFDLPEDHETEITNTCYPQEAMRRYQGRLNKLQRLHFHHIFAGNVCGTAHCCAELGWWLSVLLEAGLRRAVKRYLKNEGWWRARPDRAGVGEWLGTRQARTAE